VSPPAPPEGRRGAIALAVLGLLVGGLGFLLPDERLAALCFILAVPMIAAGAITVAWSNATREIARLRDRDR
jgi:hypothetical protein